MKMKIYSSILLLLLMPLTISAFQLPAKDNRKKIGPKYEYVMKVDRSAVAVVDSSLVVSLQLTAIQDIPFSQSVIVAPEILDTTSLRKVELPLIFINSRNQQIYFERDLKSEFPGALALQTHNGEDRHIS